MCPDNLRGLRPNQRSRFEAFTSLWIGLAPDLIRKVTAKPRLGDLPAPGGLQVHASFRHRGADRLFARLDPGRHHGDEVGCDIEAQFHAGVSSKVQTSRSRSLRGSPWIRKVSSPIRICSLLGRGSGISTTRTSIRVAVSYVAVGFDGTRSRNPDRRWSIAYPERTRRVADQSDSSFLRSANSSESISPLA